MSIKLVLKDVICSYVYLRQPRESQDGADPKYSLQIIIDKNDPQVTLIKKAIADAARSKFGDKIKIGMLKIPLRDGDEERDGDEYKGKYFMNANASQQPQIVNRYNQPATEQDLDEYCYSGATYCVSVSVYAFDRPGQKGVALGLNNVMLRKKTERLDGRVSATSEFAEFAEKNENDPFGGIDNGSLDDEDIDF